MPFKFDPEVLTGMLALMGGQERPPPLAVGDIAGRRIRIEAMLASVAGRDMPRNVTTRDYYATAPDGHKILCRMYMQNGPKSGLSSAVLYIHGGGMILGSVELYNPTVARYVARLGVPFISVDYKLAPENPYPVPVNDCYAGLVWLFDHAAELGIDSKRIAVMGDSGGGGLAAATALLARERGGPRLAKQILVYPMLDDRNIVVDPHLVGFAGWAWADNETGWGALLGEKRGKEDVPETAAPARMKDATGLPPMFIDTGELDIFRDEIIEYAAKFGRAGVSAELHVYPGCPHGFDAYAQNSTVSRKAYEMRDKAILSIEPVQSDSKL